MSSIRRPWEERGVKIDQQAESDTWGRIIKTAGVESQ